MSTDWIEADWPAPAGIIAGTTTRRGGVSAGAYHSMNLGAHDSWPISVWAWSQSGLRRSTVRLYALPAPQSLSRRMRQSRGGRAPPRRC
jgi:hypothetical protein